MDRESSVVLRVETKSKQYTDIDVVAILSIVQIKILKGEDECAG